MTARRTVVSVVGGSREKDPETLAIAEALGRGIRRSGWCLACGGMTGVMEAVCRGFQAAEGPGVAVGILPTRSADDANEHLDLVIPTGLGLARNVLVVLAADAVVAVGGETGTLSEIALAWQHGRPVVAVLPAGGFGAELAGRRLDARRSDTVLGARNVEEALEILRSLLDDVGR